MLLNCELKLLLLHISASAVEPQGCQQEGDLIQCLALFTSDPPRPENACEGEGRCLQGRECEFFNLGQRVKGLRGHLWPAGAT